MTLGAAAPRSAGVHRAAPVAATFFPAVEGMRAVAAVLVVVVHTAFVAGITMAPGAAGAYTARAEVGVGVFFLISGFLLYRPFAAARLAGRPPPSAGRFLVRRALRILPLYWVALAVALALDPAARPHEALGWVLIPGLAQVYRERDVYLGLPQAWSLDVEAIFYLTVPLWSLLVGRLARRARSPVRVELWALGGLYAFGLLTRWLFELSPVHWKLWHGFFPVWTDLFALGMGLAVLSVRWSAGHAPAWLSRPGTAEVCWLGAGGCYVLLATAIGLGRAPLYDRRPGQAVAEELLWGLFALLLLLPAVAGSGGPVRWLLRCRPLTLAGLVSYGIYLWHQLVIDQLQSRGAWSPFRVPFGTGLVTVLGIAVAAAAVSYVLVERPGIALGRRLTRRRDQAASAQT